MHYIQLQELNDEYVLQKKGRAESLKERSAFKYTHGKKIAVSRLPMRSNIMQESAKSRHGFT
jgi:hypothetical protein